MVLFVKSQVLRCSIGTIVDTTNTDGNKKHGEENDECRRFPGIAGGSTRITKSRYKTRQVSRGAPFP